MNMKKNIIISKVNIPSRFFLAPMAGYTDYVFRKICRKFGAGLLVTELVSAAALARKIKKTYRYMEYSKDEYPLSLQLFGDNEDDFKRAIELNDFSFFSFIDINMGCPTRKVIRSGSGSKLLTDIDKMLSIIRAVKSVSPIPVSVKIRLGFKRGEGGEVERALAIKEENPSFITVHGRYASDMYRGLADWECIAKIKEALGDFTVIGNGDIKTKEEAKIAFDISKVNGIMIGRAAIGAPWLFNSLNDLFDEGNELKKYSLKDIIKEHLIGCCELYGEVSGVHFMRKFIMKYLGGLNRDIKINFMKCEDKKSIFKLLDDTI